MEVPALLAGIVRVATIGLVAAAVYQYGRYFRKEASRRRWRQTLTRLADDLGPGSGGFTLSDVFSFYDEEDSADLAYELERMPPGSRSRARALAIIDGTGYSRVQRRLSPANRPVPR